MKIVEMSDYRRAAKIYWIATVFAGAAVCVWAAERLANLNGMQWAEFAVLLSVVILASSHPIRIPNTKSSFTASDTFTFLSVLFLGVPAAIVIGVVDSYVSSRRTSKRAASWIAAPSMMAVSVFLSGNAFYLALNRFVQVTQNPLRIAQIPTPFLVAAVAGMAVLHYFVNGFAISTIYALKNRNSILKNWRDGYLWTWWSFLAAAIATTVIYSAISRFGIVYTLLSIPVIAATFWTYEIYFEKINAKTREAEEMSQLHLSTVEALA